MERVDSSGRKEAVIRRNLPGVLPSREPPFFAILECLEEKMRFRRAAMENDFADDLKEIRAFRERFETNTAESTPAPRVMKRNSVSPRLFERPGATIIGGVGLKRSDARVKNLPRSSRRRRRVPSRIRRTSLSGVSIHPMCR